MMRIACAVAAAIALAGCDFEDFGPSDRYKSDFHYSYDLNPSGRIEIESFNGSVEVHGWDQNKVEVNGTKYGSTEALRDAVRINISPSPDSIVIRAERSPDLQGSFRGSMGARFTISAPKSAVIGRAVSSNGPLRIVDLSGDGHFRTSNASIRVENEKGAVDATTSNGLIEVSGVQGDAILHTSNGRINAEGVEGDVEARTNNNGIRVRMDHAPALPVRLETSNGPIELTMLERPKADVRAATSNGGITVHLPEDTSARISAATSNSSVSSDFDITTHGQIVKNHLDGAIAGGGPAIVLTTSNGSIRVLRGQ